MSSNIRLTEGSIVKSLIKLAVPIIGTSFMEMAYNMTDMIWIGRVGSKAVASVGTAGFFTWLAMAFILIPKIGAEIGVAQSVGGKDMDAARSYIRHAIQLNVTLAVIYSLSLIVFRNHLISFFNLGDYHTINDAVNYLTIVSLGMVFYFINPVFTAIFNGYGDSRTPFKVNAVGLLTNIVLDPVLIFGIGPLPTMGVKGAAIATVFAQSAASLFYIYNARKKYELFCGFNLFRFPDWALLRRIVRLGVPAAVQSGLFTFFSMLIARIISNWGPIPIAVQKVGSQIEAISWMTAGGFETALSAFVGQNFGALKWDRIKKGYYTALGIASTIGIFATCLLIFGARPIFSFFIPEEETIKYGIVYLKILGLSQLFMCIEITTAGAFNGIGKTLPPSIVGVLFNALRIPGAFILSSIPSLGLDGVWWSISISSMFKGVVLSVWFMMHLEKHI